MAILFNSLQQKNQYLQLQVPNITCGIPLHQVKKIFSLMALTAIPEAPHYLAGVFNYQGSLVPVMDLGLRLGQTPLAAYTSNTCVVLCNTPENETFLGLIVGSVGNVIEISHSEIHLAPQFPGKLSPFSGIYRQQRQICFLLNTDALLNSSLTELYAALPAEIQIVAQKILKAGD